jgi:hypothetical protein
VAVSACGPKAKARDAARMRGWRGRTPTCARVRPSGGDDDAAQHVSEAERKEAEWAATGRKLGGWYWAELGCKVGRLRAEKESGAGSKKEKG